MKTKEELKNSFIRYQPEITKDVFKRIIDRIEQLGFRQYCTYNNYEDFVSNCLVLHGDGFWYIINEYGMNKRPEIEVSDILGDGWRDVKWSVDRYVALEEWAKEGQIKWSATLPEAEAFSKSLLGQREAFEELFPEYSKPTIKKSKEFDRNWYVKVSSQEEADLVLDWLKNKGEETTTDFKFVENMWSKIWFFLNPNYRCHNTWCIGDNEALPTNLKEKQLSDIIPEYKQSSGCIFLEPELDNVTVELIDVPDI